MRLQDFAGSLKDQTVVVIGNGPSLKEKDLVALSAKYKTLGANKIYTLPFMPDYWTCVDDHMGAECSPDMLDRRDSGEWMPSMFTKSDWGVPGAVQLNIVIVPPPKQPPFSVNATRYVVIGGTVTYVNLQLAYYMGAKTALLIGVDNYYPKRESDGRPGSLFTSDGDDPDHFVPRDGSAYFKKNRRYARPESKRVDSQSYAIARKFYEADGRRIVNLTPNTKAEAFEKGDLKDWI